MNNYEALFEDENDIFGGTPQSKYWSTARQLESDVWEAKFDTMMDRVAAMEKMLMDKVGEEYLNEAVKSYILDNIEAIEEHKKSLYLEYTGELIYALSE
jgi:hypothetical protein